MQAVSMARFSIMWRFIDEPARRQVLELALTSQILYIMLACALIKIIEVREWWTRKKGRPKELVNKKRTGFVSDGWEAKHRQKASGRALKYINYHKERVDVVEVSSEWCATSKKLIHPCLYPKQSHQKWYVHFFKLLIEMLMVLYMSMKKEKRRNYNL